MIYFIISLLITITPAPQPPKGGVLKESLNIQYKQEKEKQSHIKLSDLQKEEFPSYDNINLLNNKDLLILLKTNNNQSTENNILSIIKDRIFTLDDLDIPKLTLSKRIELVKRLNSENINMIKFSPIYFTALASLKNSIFNNSDRKYLFKVLQEAIKQKRVFVIKKIFSLPKIVKLGFFNSIILMRSFKDEDKILFLSVLRSIDINIIKKRKFKKKCLEKLYKLKNPELLKSTLYLLPKFFTFNNDDLVTIFTKIDLENQVEFINSMTINNIKIPQTIIDNLKLSNEKAFIAMLKYSDKNNIKIKKLKNHLDSATHPLGGWGAIIPYINLYLNSKIFKKITKNEKLFLHYLTNTIESNKTNKFLKNYSKKEYKNIKLNTYIRVLLTKYIINNRLLKNKKILIHIISLFKNKKLEYKSDEYYISIILPILANNYKKADSPLYKKLLKMLNKTAIESTLEAIKISKDKRFIKDLKPLLNENEIKDFVKKTICSLED